MQILSRNEYNICACVRYVKGFMGFFRCSARTSEPCNILFYLWKSTKKFIHQKPKNVRFCWDMRFTKRIFVTERERERYGAIFCWFFSRVTSHQFGTLTRLTHIDDRDCEGQLEKHIDLIRWKLQRITSNVNYGVSSIRVENLHNHWQSDWKIQCRFSL
jgi:hypothetical protein